MSCAYVVAGRDLGRVGVLACLTRAETFSCCLVRVDSYLDMYMEGVLLPQSGCSQWTVAV